MLKMHQKLFADKQTDGLEYRITTRVHFLTPVNSGRQLGCQKMHPSSRAVNSGRELAVNRL